MAHSFHILPDTAASASQHMAFDSLLLQHYTPKDAIRFRHYEWNTAAYTFGLSQRYSYVSSEVADHSAELVRRPTGGGLVDHSNDWTYTLVIPATHPFSRGLPVDAYRDVHQCMMDAMAAQGLETEFNITPPSQAAPSICFNKAELYDVILKDLPSKIAGAAQKRSKNGYMLQGSIWKPLASKLNWEQFYNDFTLGLAKLLDATVEYVNSPPWGPEEEIALAEQFESEDWNQRR